MKIFYVFYISTFIRTINWLNIKISKSTIMQVNFLLYLILKMSHDCTDHLIYVKCFILSCKWTKVLFVYMMSHSAHLCRGYMRNHRSWHLHSEVIVWVTVWVRVEYSTNADTDSRCYHISHLSIFLWFKWDISYLKSVQMIPMYPQTSCM